MLVCSVSLRQSRQIAADIAEAAGTATDTAATLTAWLMVDDNAAAVDSVDGFVGAIVLEAANADDAADGTLLFAAVAVDEPLAATDTQSSSVIGAPTTTWNPADKGPNIVLSNGNLTAACPSGANSVRGTSSHTTGKYYFEVLLGGTGGNLGIGVALATMSTSGIGPTGAAYENVANGAAFINGTNSGTVAIVAPTETCCVAVDFSNLKIWFRKNNGTWDANVSHDPATNTGGFSLSAFSGSALFPVYASNSATGENGTANFGATAFTYSVPSGFSAWG